MASTIPDSHLDILQSKAIAHLATLMPDGRPQVTPVWFGFDGEHILVNSAKGRQKDRNIRRDPRVSLSICDTQNDYRYLEIRGTVTEITEEGGVEHIDSLAGKYLGLDVYPNHNDHDVRVIYRIVPDRTTSMG